MFVDAGKCQLIGFLAAENWLGGLNFGLYVNPFSPVHNSLLSDLTEASWAGYARVNVPWSDIIVPLTCADSLDSAFNSVWNFGPPISFTNTSGVSQTFYGWFCQPTTDATLEITQFPTPQIIANGQTITFTPQILTNSLV